MSSSSSDTIVRQPMCNGDKIQLPRINKETTCTTDKGKNTCNTTVDSINDSIISHDLCYNRCPNGEAPQVDPENGTYFCYVPALVTYNVLSKNDSVDTLDYANGYSVSCQSTDYADSTDKSKPSTMYGTPILFKGGLYEDPTPPNTIRPIGFTPVGDNKWFCRRPMHGSPNISQVQSPYESLTKNISQTTNMLSTNCKSVIQGVNSYNTPSTNKGNGATIINNTTNSSCISDISDIPTVANLAITNGVKTTAASSNSLTLQPGLSIVASNINTSDGIVKNISKSVEVPGSNVVKDSTTGATIVKQLVMQGNLENSNMTLKS